MARIVMKFGGTSMAGMERIRNVAARVKHVVEQGHEVAVVVSAMSGETNRLVSFCEEASPLYDPAEYDVVVAAGEQITLNFQGNHSLVGVNVDKAAYKALIANKKVVETEGGLIVLAAGAANQLMSSVVKNTGRISANSAVNNGGVIELVAINVSAG